MENKIQKLEYVNQLLEKYDNFFFDMDGVIWRGDEKIPHSLDFLNHLTKNQKNIYFFTNNSSVSRKSYVEKLTNYGFPPDIDHIFCASYICVSYLKKNHPDIKKVFIIGMDGLIEEFESAGYEVIPGKRFEDLKQPCQDYANVEIDKDIKAVIVGVDYSFNFYKLFYASACIQNSALYFATNEDPNIKLGKHKVPGAGSMNAAITTASETKPITTGKPNPVSINILCEKEGFDKKKCLMIGDSFYTDIPFGRNAGIDTLFVLSGVTTKEEMQNYLTQESMAKPTYYAENLKLQA